MVLWDCLPTEAYWLKCNRVSHAQILYTCFITSMFEVIHTLDEALYMQQHNQYLWVVVLTLQAAHVSTMTTLLTAGCQ